MKTHRSSTVRAMAARLIGALLAAAAALPSASAIAAPRWGADYFPNVPLTTHEGKTVRFYDDLIKGKSVVVNLIYTECKDECPLETAKLAKVQTLLGERVGKDIFFYSISIDPKHDTPEVLTAYMRKFGVGPGWLFLTGKEADIAIVSKKLGLSSRTDYADRDGHIASLMIGNEPAGQWMRSSAVDNPRFIARKIGSFLKADDKQLAGLAKDYALARPIRGLDAGTYLFRTRCADCHTIGKGDAVGPDLSGVTDRRERAWLARYLAEPAAMLAEGDPTATALHKKYQGVRMPNLSLAADDIATLISYLDSQGSAARKAAVRDPAPPR